MLNTYKFKYKYQNGGIKVSGSGEVKAEAISEAKIAAEDGIAHSVGGDPANVAIISIRQVKDKKSRHE